MGSLNAFDHECIMLGMALTYGADAVKWVLPDLTHDKFIYSKEGALSQQPDHMRIWQAITLCQADKVSPTVPAVADRLQGHKDYIPYLGSLITSLKGYYQIYDLDARYIRGLATVIDRNGMIYRYAERAHKLGKVIDDPAEFMKYCGQVDDVDEWANNIINEFRGSLRPAAQGYVHVSQIASRVKETWDRIWKGEQFILLPTGLPSLSRVGLFPVGRLAIIHGTSNGGKSALTRQIALGTAIGLKKNGIQGCVAINSLEEDQDTVVAELASKLAGVNLFKLTFGPDGMTAEEKDRLLWWIDYVAELPLFVDSTNLLTASVLEYRLDSLHTSERGPVWQMAIDYLELLRRKEMDRDSKEQIVHAIASNAFTLSRQIGASVLLVSQSSTGKQGGWNKEMIAGGMGLRYSSGTYHVADIVCEVVNYPALKAKGFNFQAPPNLDENSAWLLMQKGRGMPIADPIRWEWQPEYVRFADPELIRHRNDTILFDHFIEHELEGAF